MITHMLAIIAWKSAEGGRCLFVFVLVLVFVFVCLCLCGCVRVVFLCVFLFVNESRSPCKFRCVRATKRHL